MIKFTQWLSNRINEEGDLANDPTVQTAKRQIADKIGASGLAGAAAREDPKKVVMKTVKEKMRGKTSIAAVGGLAGLAQTTNNATKTDKGGLPATGSTLV